ncbi:MAG TPA: hypothetical protein VGX51_01180 [Solirubrobacteraceae bacterium]|nr:hypothetical protein [Solirubrobacteraceae bacterium]
MSTSRVSASAYSKATTRGRKTAATKSKRAKAARTRAANQSRAAIHQANGAARLTVGDRSIALGDYAERAVLIPVGAALTARDRVVSSVNGAISVYSTPSKAQAQLRRFERRGATARNRLEREVRKARVRVERQLRQRRRVLERTVGELEDRRDTVAKNGSELAGELASRVQETVLSRV